MIFYGLVNLVAFLLETVWDGVVKPFVSMGVGEGKRKDVGWEKSWWSVAARRDAMKREVALRRPLTQLD